MRSRSFVPAPPLSRALFAALAVFSLFGLVGARCASVSRPYAAPSALEVETALRKRGAAVRALRGEARMSYRAAQGKIKATVRMMAATQGKLRFDVVTPFDTPLATLVTSSGRFSLVDAQKNRHFHGPATPCNISRLLRVQLRPEDVLTILGGATPLIPHVKRSLRWDDRAGVEVLTLVNKKGTTQTVRLDGRNRRWKLLTSRIHDAKGKLLLELRASEHKKLAGLDLPRQLKVRQPAQKAELELDFKRQEINIELPKIAFERPSGGGLSSQYVDCGTQVVLDGELPRKASPKSKAPTSQAAPAPAPGAKEDAR